MWIYWLVSLVVAFLLGAIFGRRLARKAATEAAELMSSAAGSVQSTAGDILKRNRGSIAIEAISILAVASLVVTAAVANSVFVNVAVFVMFALGLVLSNAFQASLIISKHGSPDINDWGTYWSKRWPLIVFRSFVELTLFMVWAGGASATPEDMSGKFLTAWLTWGAMSRLGGAGLIGAGIDSLLDRALARLGLEKLLATTPPTPPPTAV